MSRVTDVLTTIRSVNKTDVANLSTSLGCDPKQHVSCLLLALNRREIHDDYRVYPILRANTLGRPFRP